MFTAGACPLDSDGRVVTPDDIPGQTRRALAGATSGRAAAYGPAMMLRPLPPGHHTLVRVRHFSGSSVSVNVYNITVA